MVQNPGFKIFTVTALGAFIGSLVGLQLTPMFWWVGMLVGGIVGYFAYNFSEVIRAIPLALEQARIVWRRLAGVDYVSALRTFWGETREGLLAWGELTLILSVGAVIFTLVGAVWLAEIVVGLAVGFTLFMSSLPMSWPTPGENEVVVLLIISIMLGAVVNLFALLMWTDHHGMYELQNRKTRAALMMLYKATPLGAITLYLPKLLWLAMRLSPAAAQAVGAFWWSLFKLIHSDRRLLCGVDAAIGAAVGISAHNPLLGALAGGVVGVLNFELISKRWLKLVPTT